MNLSWPGADLFTNGPVRELRIEVPAPGFESLRKNPRQFVPARVGDGDVWYDEVALHLKGSLGSFQSVDAKPGLTLDFCRLKPGRKFHGLRRIHLNNSVEDPSYSNEQLGSELFRAAGVPAPRVARALVELNGRRLGLYILKEGFTEDFLCCHFQNLGGNLYEPDEGHDVDQRLKRNSIQAPRQGRGDLERLAAAALEPDPHKRWERLQSVLEVDRFLAFMALEVMLCHRDGYCLARNNFRVYHSLDSGKMVFLPSGMDQLLGKADLPWQPHMSGLVARVLMETTEGKAEYDRCFRRLFQQLFKPDALAKTIEQNAEPLRAALPTSEFHEIKRQSALMQDRLEARERDLKAQLARPEPKPLDFSKGFVLLTDWTKTDEPPSGKMSVEQSADGGFCLHILTRSDTAASWRARALLNQGSYRLEGQARISGVRPLPYGKHQGAALRVGQRARDGRNFSGDSSWRLLQAPFEVTDTCEEVEFICELRASAGEAWFKLDSLRVVQTADRPRPRTQIKEN